MLGLALLAMIASILVTLLSAKIGAKLSRDIRSDVFRKSYPFPIQRWINSPQHP